MSYIRKIVGRDEKLILLTRLHWIYPIEGLVFFALLIIVGIFLNNIFWNYFGASVPDLKLNLYLITININMNVIIPFTFGLIGLAIFWSLFIAYLSTEIGLTDQRIIYKKGLFMINIQQVELEDIRGEAINHGWLGWILGYGRIHFDCRFIDDLYLPATRNPYRLVKAVHTARMRHDEIFYNKDDLDLDIARINDARIKAFKARNKLQNIARKIKRDFNSSNYQNKNTKNDEINN